MLVAVINFDESLCINGKGAPGRRLHADACPLSEASAR